MLTSERVPSPRTRRRRADDRGSVALVVIVMVIMASLGAVMISRNANDLRVVVIGQHQAQADAAADLGIARAVARIQNGQGSAPFTDVGRSGGATWDLRATPITPGRWDVTSRGSSSTSRREVGVSVVSRPDGTWVATSWHLVPGA